MSDKLEKLKKLQAARRGRNVSDDEEAFDKIYDEIDEKEYKLRKRQELLQDDFVVDDDGVGYVDRGVDDDWDKNDQYFSDEDDSKNKKQNKGKTSDPSINQKPISNLIKAQHSKNLLKQQQSKKTLNVDDFDDILGEFDNASITRLSAKQSSSRLPSSPNFTKRQNNPNSSLTNIVKKQKIEANSSIGSVIDLDSSPLKVHTKSKFSTNDVSDLIRDVENSPTMIRKRDNTVHNSASSPTKPTHKDTEESLSNNDKAQEDDDNDDDDDDDDIIFKRRTVRSVSSNRQVNFNPKSNPSTSPFVTAPGTPIDKKISIKKIESQTASEALTFSNKYTKSQIVNTETNSFQMFWFDFAEVNNTLVLFGKIKALDGTLVSAMVQIDNLYRELYFLPRSDKTPTDVHEEIIPLLMEKYGLENIRSKPQKMKYAFEIAGVPHDAEYLKVLLPYNTPKSSYDLIPSTLSSDNFSRVFGGSTNIFESFVVQNKIMGPCWLEIKDGDFTALQNASHCSVEVQVSKPQDIVPTENKSDCNLACTSVAVQTMMNPKENKQEVICITLSSYKSVSLDSPIPEDLKPDNIVTLVRPPQGTSFPVGLATLTKQKLPGQVRLFNNEKTMLACFCAMIKIADPDVLIGHRLESVYLDVLMHRMHDLNIPTFSSLGRRVRKAWPDKFGKSHSGMNHFFIKEILAGRLICDIGNEMGQSLTPKCQNWDLAEMYQIACGIEHKILDVNYQSPIYQNDANTMNMAINENIVNSMIAAEVSFRIQMLSLTKQLTNLAGNGWAQTLSGTRAGRNEYILLHEFARNGYIVPDKETQKMKAQRQKIEYESNPDAPPPSKKAKYQGGLVFEPEKGLHKNYVLVMDFNSLYPSIIQEFNICFTTVNRNLNDIDELPETPNEDQAQGVLPRLLANLVDRRREVKKLMKTETDPHKRVQCDIRQQALKLTANSMYGCLGYVNSRFYAKPLAMLVTNKGREILMNTRQLAEGMNLVVVYGDTDSVMIDTGCETYEDAIKIGQNFKKLVNDRYKLLEIDIDNVFKKLLLHAKKKYAALNVSIDKDGKEHTILEVKGLDMKRREYCPLSKDISTHILNTILSDVDPESALQEIYAYLEDIKTKIEENSIRIDKYKINTKLSKDPKAYPGGKTMPAVQVALRMREAGRVVKAGTVITFIITKPQIKNGEMVQSHPAERAYALTEVIGKDTKLAPDPEYYLEKQIMAPVERLLERIEGFDVVRLSEALGLDSKKFVRRSTDENVNGINGLQPLETTISDMERFKDTSELELNCPKCSEKFPFGGIVASNYYKLCYNGLQCKKCNHIFSPLQLAAQVESSIRSHISLYYAGWLICDDHTCGNVTRQLSVFGKRCLNEGCTGVMRYRYTDKQLYNQLLYFESLFDCEKNKSQIIKPIYYDGDNNFPTEALTESSIKALTEQNRELFENNRSVVQKYLRSCGRRYVDLGTIFDFMPVKP